MTTIELSTGREPTGWALEIQDAERVRRVVLGSRPVVVGSSRAAEVVVADRTVSRVHCEVSASARGVAVRDLGSTNGTFIGGARIAEGYGGAGTTIGIGQTTAVCLPEGTDDEDDDLEAEPLSGFAGSSAIMRRLAAHVRALAQSSAPVLIVGESGTGKELVARALHEEGPRQRGPLVALNVTALPRELVESELFGHERGAFTGAIQRREGAFAEAEGGTLFFDEIGDLELDAQPKLLRALDGYGVRRVGELGNGRRPNVRIVAATHVNLEAAVAAGRFRRDLYHRLEVFVVELPPLRHRSGDLPAIARTLLARREAQLGARELTPAALAKLMAHSWPGNIRELDGVLQRASTHAKTRWIDAGAIERAIRGRTAAPSFTRANARLILDRHGGNMSAAARAAGLPRTTFRKLLA